MGLKAISRDGQPVQTSFLRSMWAVVWKDTTAEFRSRELLSAMLVFSLLVVLIFNFALELNARERQEVTAGVIWVTIAFAGTLGLNRSMAVEKDGNCLDGLLLAPVDRAAIYFGKVISNLLFMLIVMVIILPIYSILYNQNLFVPGLLGTIVLGIIGYVVSGTLLASMSVQTRTRDVLLPILHLPVALPVVIAAVRASAYFLQGQPMDLIWPSINLLIGYNVIFTAAAYMLFDFVVQE
ncbi:MAG: cytochrome C biogenesis protein [Anaerolineae bacterium]|nr:MAG: cytochrome C biogenesis protein [Anaerolineae bacterium]